ncbi:MAG TPA: ankyrin repeat domain-containing protein [Gemmatimonas sp.]|nr:ankyrin repeat domain-containing protein [Gemmatimonas sp.]
MTAPTEIQRLAEAIVAGDITASEALLDAHPGLASSRTEGGESVVLMALYRGHTALAERLASGTETDACEAAALGNAARLQSILAKTAGSTGAGHRDTLEARPIHMFSSDGWTPLHLAGFFGHEEAAVVLLDGGASLDVLSTNSTANTPLHASLAGRVNDRLVKLLVGRGADVNARGAHGLTPLHLAASRGAEALVMLLLVHGADVNAATDDGRTASDIARERGHENTAALLES